MIKKSIKKILDPLQYNNIDECVVIMNTLEQCWYNIGYEYNINKMYENSKKHVYNIFEGYHSINSPWYIKIEEYTWSYIVKNQVNLKNEYIDRYKSFNITQDNILSNEQINEFNIDTTKIAFFELHYSYKDILTTSIKNYSATIEKFKQFENGIFEHISNNINISDKCDQIIQANNKLLDDLINTSISKLENTSIYADDVCYYLYNFYYKTQFINNIKQKIEIYIKNKCTTDNN